MLRKLSWAYLILAGGESVYLLYTAIGSGVFSTLMPWFVWAVNIAGLVAVYTYAARKSFLHGRLWLAVLVTYVFVRVVELYHGGLFNPEVSVTVNLFIALRYAWYVLLCMFAIAYCAGINRGKMPYNKSSKPTTKSVST